MSALDTLGLQDKIFDRVQQVRRLFIRYLFEYWFCGLLCWSVTDEED